MSAVVSESDDNGRDAFVCLGRLKKHRGSHAFDISEDGNVVVGFSAGPDPPTMVPGQTPLRRTFVRSLLSIAPVA